MTPAAPARRVPPGPDIHLTVQSVQRDPLGFLMDLTRRYGDVVRYQADDWTVIFVNRPAYVRHVLQDNHQNYPKIPMVDNKFKRVSGEGLLTSGGSFWLRQRRLMQPVFHRQRIAAYMIKALREADPDNRAPVPVDLVTASGSGLDPAISVAAAEYRHTASPRHGASLKTRSVR